MKGEKLIPSCCIASQKNIFLPAAHNESLVKKFWDG